MSLRWNGYQGLQKAYTGKDGIMICYTFTVQAIKAYHPYTVYTMTRATAARMHSSCQQCCCAGLMQGHSDI
jgi:hypothetical protein